MTGISIPINAGQAIAGYRPQPARGQYRYAVHGIHQDRFAVFYQHESFSRRERVSLGPGLAGQLHHVSRRLGC